MLSGAVINYILTLILFGVSPTAGLGYTAIFFCVSYLRSYLVRRFFRSRNELVVESELTIKHPVPPPEKLTEKLTDTPNWELRLKQADDISICDEALGTELTAGKQYFVREISSTQLDAFNDHGEWLRYPRKHFK